MSTIPADRQSTKDAIHLAIGRIAADWGAIDFTLDGLIQIIRTYDDAPSEDFPRSLKRKLRFIREAFGTVWWLRQFADEGHAILDRVHQLKERRHKLVHGIILETVRNELGYSISYSDFRYGKRAIGEEPFSPADLERLSTEVHALTRDFTLLCLRLTDRGVGEIERSQQDQ